jgi:hypothetical protein
VFLLGILSMKKEEEKGEREGGRKEREERERGKERNKEGRKKGPGGSTQSPIRDSQESFSGWFVECRVCPSLAL